ncbi:MAG: type II toxin-antitoxin system PemK/MazF family toxin [Acidimicrobiales bacterium]
MWLADSGGESRRLVFVISDARFHRVAERAVVAPVLDSITSAMPWHLPLNGRVVAINQLGTLPIERLLEHVETASFDVLRRARRAVSEIIG